MTTHLDIIAASISASAGAAQQSTLLTSHTQLLTVVTGACLEHTPQHHKEGDGNAHQCWGDVAVVGNLTVRISAVRVERVTATRVCCKPRPDQIGAVEGDH